MQIVYGCYISIAPHDGQTKTPLAPSIIDTPPRQYVDEYDRVLLPFRPMSMSLERRKIIFHELKLNHYDELLTEWNAALNGQNDTFHFSAYYASRKTYYALHDIDGNGIMELLLTNGNVHEDIIAYIFTIKDSEPINLFGYDNEGRPHQAPWSRRGSSRILDNGFIDCKDGAGIICKIAEDGYSLIEFYA